MCGQCLATPPIHDGVMAAVAYGETARSIILKFKYGGKPGLAKTIAKYLVRYVEPYRDALIVPVPLHKWRLWSRGFNQSAMIAHQLSRANGAAHVPDLLLRTKKTPVLRGLGRLEREKTVSGAFTINPRHHASIKNKTIVLIDDVYTTGSTTNACAKVLKRAGAARVYILCWARVIEEHTMDH